MSLSVSLTHKLPGFALDVDFQTGGAVTALIGPSGAGKTTILNAVAGLIRPDRCRITLGDHVLEETANKVWTPPSARAVGYVFQDHRLFPHLNVRQNLAYGQRRRRLASDPTQEANIIEMLGIAPLLDRRIGGLSGGERARIGIARALFSRPKILLMDEPLAALDQARKDEILPYLEAVRDGAEIPILYVSHALDEAIRLASSLVVLREGRVAQTGETGAMLSDPASHATLGLRELGALLSGLVTPETADGLTAVDIAGGRLWVALPAAINTAQVRLRVRASDVILSREAPSGLSALNALPAQVEGIHLMDGPHALVALRLGEARVLAQITRRSVAALQLSLGADCFAILKSVAVTADDISGG